METILIVSNIFLWLISAITLILVLAVIQKLNQNPFVGNSYQPKILNTGTNAPDFSVHSTSGTTANLSDYVGQDLAMVFISSTCGPCHEQLPNLANMYPYAQRSGVELMIVNLEDIDKTKLFAEEKQIQIPLWSASREENDLHENYSIPGTPSYYLIDKEGRIVSGGFLDDKWAKLTEKWQNS